MGVRERRDVRPADLARAVGVSGATVSDWEAGKILPREDALEKLGAFLGVTPAYLRYGITENPGTAQPIAVLDVPDRIARTLSEARKAERADTHMPPPDAAPEHLPRPAKAAGGRRGPGHPKDRR